MDRKDDPAFFRYLTDRRDQGCQTVLVIHIFLTVGGKGSMTSTAGIMPEIMIGIYEAWQKEDYKRARKLQFSILPAVRAMFSLPFPLGFKVALEVRGFKLGPPKQPLSDTDRHKFNTAKAEIEKILKSILASLKGNAKQ